METPEDPKYGMVLRDALHRALWQYCGHRISLHDHVNPGKRIVGNEDF